MKILPLLVASLPLVAAIADCGGDQSSTSTTSSSSSSSSSGSSSASSSASSSSSSSGAGGAGGSAPDPIVDVDKLSATAQSVTEIEPVVGVASDGRVLAAWIAFDALGDTFVQTAASKDGGATWGKPQKVLDTQAGLMAIDPSIATDDQGNALVAWLGYQYASPTPKHMAVHVAHAGPGATSLSKASIAIPETGNVLDKPWLVHANGLWVLAWVETDQTPSSRARVATSSDGATWSAPHALAGASDKALVRLCAPASGKRLVATYLVPGATPKVGVQTSDDLGATWSAETIVSGADAVGWDAPTCVASTTDAWVSYTIGTGPYDAVNIQQMTAVRVARSKDLGATFAPAVDAHDAKLGKLFLHPSLALEGDGTLDVAYYAGAQAADVHGALLLARSTDGGATFASEKQHEPVGFDLRRDNGGFCGDYLGIARRGKDLHLVYGDDAPPYVHIAYRRIPSH